MSHFQSALVHAITFAGLCSFMGALVLAGAVMRVLS